MKREDLGVYLTVISHGRPHNVAKLQELIGPATWVVSSGSKDSYLASGAAAVIEGGPLCRSRNVALRNAWAYGQTCVQLSDDLTKLQLAVWDGDKGKIVAAPCTFPSALGKVLAGMDKVGARLGGVAPTANPFYANVTKPTHSAAFIVGDFIAVKPCGGIVFNENMSLKEDYDYTLQHFQTFGCVARQDDVLATFLHRTNSGGAVAVRTSGLEQENIALLKKRWPEFIRDNPRRPNEILLKMKGKRA